MKTFIASVSLFAMASMAMVDPPVYYPTSTYVNPGGPIQPEPTVTDPCGQCTEGHMCPEFCMELPQFKKRQSSLSDDPCGQCTEGHMCPEFCTEVEPVKQRAADECAQCAEGEMCPDYCLEGSPVPLAPGPVVFSTSTTTSVAAKATSVPLAPGPVEPIDPMNPGPVILDANKRAADECAPCTTGGVCPDFCIMSSLPPMPSATSNPSSSYPNSRPGAPVCDCCQCDAECGACPDCECVEPLTSGTDNIKPGGPGPVTRGKLRRAFRA